MGVKLDDLIAAAERFKRFREAQTHADPAAVAAERLELGLRNATDFTSKADRLSVLANVISKQPQAAVAARAIPPPLLDPIEAGHEALLTLTQDFVPI